MLYHLSFPEKRESTSYNPSPYLNLQQRIGQRGYPLGVLRVPEKLDEGVIWLEDPHLASPKKGGGRLEMIRPLLS